MLQSSPVCAGASLVVPHPAYLPPAALAVSALSPRACRWPIGEPRSADFAFCGAERLARGSYCARHARVARRPGRDARSAGEIRP